jgi:2-oxoglutarate ferredoxin oxidoreductase subunit delta
MYQDIYMKQLIEKTKAISHVIDKEWCKGCGICIYFCPKKVLNFDNHGKAEAEKPQDCILCRLCEIRCPDFAIQVIEQEREGENG